MSQNDVAEVGIDQVVRTHRFLAIAALRDVDWGDKTVAVRVKGLDTRWGWRDMVEVAQSSPRLDLILLPKAGGSRHHAAVDYTVVMPRGQLNGA